MSIQEELAALQERINAATAAQARAQVQYDNAVVARDKALAELETYGVSTAAEAKELLATLEAELTEQIAKVHTALEEAGA